LRWLRKSSDEKKSSYLKKGEARPAQSKKKFVHALSGERVQRSKSFLVLFFKKEHSFFFFRFA